MMKLKRILTLLAAAVSLASARPAGAGDPADAEQASAPAATLAQDQPSEAQVATPEASPPADPAPAPPSANAPGSPVPGEKAPAARPPGQWVYTSQYGWVWMPFADTYTWVPPGGWGEPYQYVYYPTFGWTWVVAPWIWGWGPCPFFGIVGPGHFWWWQRGWWRHPDRWHFVPSPAWHRPGFVHPPPMRSGHFQSVPFRSSPGGGWGMRRHG
jgi:hypothetical protein